MPFALALLLALPIGVGIAWAAKAELARHDGRVTATRAFAVTATFSGGVYAIQMAYFAAFHGDWSYAYAVASSRVPSAIDLLLVVACAAMVVGAFTIASPFAARGRIAVVASMFATPMALCVGLVIAGWQRLTTSASYAQFEGGFGTHTLTETSLGRAIVVANAVSLAALGWSIRLVRVDLPRSSKGP